MTQNFDEAKDIQEDLTEEEYYVQPARATFYYDEGMDEAEPLEEEGDAPAVEAPQAEILDGSDLELPPELSAEEKQAETESTPDFQKFNEDFKKYAGVDFKEAMEAFNSVRQELNQKKVSDQRVALQKDWGLEGDEFDSRLTQVVERFAKYPPEVQAKYDNNEGAKLIWAAIERDNAKLEKQVPGLQRSSAKVPAISQPKYLYSETQINKMSNEEYAKHASRITAAYAKGQVKLK